ncbi:MAG: hypothetical protein HRU20_15020 [Pseudomonadales bacterium]|nr:hypothetical protein [Pseudomonadales bacterium]
MNYQDKIKRCLSLIKDEVKTQGDTYQQLADKLEVSLLTVKRQLNAGEISMSKLLALCDAVGLDFIDVWNTIEQQENRNNVFTQEQDLAFYQNPALYTYFKALFHFQQTPKDIENISAISPASTEAYMNKLQDIGIIKRTDDQYFKFLVTLPIDFSDDSAMVTHNIHKNLKTIGDKIVSQEPYADLLLVKSLKLNDEIRAKMYEEIQDIANKYANLSQRYFELADLPEHQLFICDYLPERDVESELIVDVIAFEE